MRSKVFQRKIYKAEHPNTTATGEYKEGRTQFTNVKINGAWPSLSCLGLRIFFPDQRKVL